MKLLVRSLIFFVSLFSLFIPLVPIAFATTTPFRSASIVTADGSVSYSNLSNCSSTDGLTCDRPSSIGTANLNFKGFGSYNDFGMSDGSVISRIKIRVTGKTSNVAYVGMTSSNIDIWPFTWNNCQYPSDLWTLWYLSGNIINVNNFTSNVIYSGTVTQGISSSCVSSYNLENNKLILRVNGSSPQTWTSNIDNLEIAFDYNPGPTPTPTPSPTPSPTPTPTLTPAPTPILKTPLILIPGIGGSEFKSNQTFMSNIRDCGILPTAFQYNADDIVWVDTVRAGVSPCDDYFDVLKLKIDGQTLEYPQIVLSGTLFEGAYGGMVKFFADNGYELNKTLFLFPYDWRRDIFLTSTPLNDFINAVKTQTGNTKVDIMAHSMGGLVARNYIADAAKAQNVRKLFTLGTPHLGSVDYLKNLLYGECFTIFDFLKNLYVLVYRHQKQRT